MFSPRATADQLRAGIIAPPRPIMFRAGPPRATLGDQPPHEVSTMKEIISTEDAPGSGAWAAGGPAFSQAVRAAGLVFVSGQGPFDPTSGKMVGTTSAEQTRQCLHNVEAVLRAAGSSLENVVSATFFLRHSEDFDGMNEEWVRWFPEDPPARQGAQHPRDIEGLRVAVSVIALA